MTAMRIRLHAFARATLAVFLLCIHNIKAADAGETLFNGIVLPREWPPHLSDFPTSVEKEAGGTLTTRPVRFGGRHLFVNVDDPKGELRVENLNDAGQLVPHFTVDNCTPVTANKTLHSVRWNGVEGLSSLAGQPVRFRLHLKNGKPYAFWVSPENSRASHGYVAAAGPGFSSNRDL